MQNNRFVLTLSILLLSSFIITSFISYYVAHNSFTKHIAETTLPLTSDNIYSEIQRDLLRPIFISSLMAKDTFLRDWSTKGEYDEKEIIRYLSDIQKTYGTATSFFISEKTRKYYHPKGVLKKINENDPNDNWLFHIKKMHNDYDINISSDTEDNNLLTIFINYRVYNYSNDYIGVTGVGLAVESVRKMINTYQNRYGRRIYFIDREGLITLRGSNQTGPENIRQIQGLSQYATQILASPSNSITYQENGKSVYLNSRLIPEFDWYLLVDHVDDPSKSLILKTLFVNVAVSLVITLIVLFIVNMTIGKYQKKLEEMATTDKLTGLANRHIFDMLFNQALKYCQRRGVHLSAIMIDIDKFKKINDTYGHNNGDIVLKNLSQTAKSQLRDSDLLFRWGGEEFLILLPDCNGDQSAVIAEKIRNTLENKKIIIDSGHSISVTASFGVAQLLDDELQNSLIKRADTALYKAKENGRNRVEMAA